MATNKKPTTTATSMEPSNTRPHRPPNARMVQNFHLVWLDGSIDEVNNDSCHDPITKLQQVVSIVNTFGDVDQCIDFITDVKQEKTFMIVSGEFSQTIVPIIQGIPQVNSIYIFCRNKPQYEKWAQQWSKVEGVFTDITSLCEALEKATQVCDQNSISISFVQPTDGVSHQNLDTLDQSFMYTQILKEILLTIDFQQEHINEFLTYCREQFVGNTAQVKNVDQIDKEYRFHQPIWWYTSPYFLYSMLNRALRLMEVDIIIKMGFFIRDLHNHIVALYVEQYGEQSHSNSFTVYRGQGLSQTDFHQMMKTEGGLISFNNFLSTSLDRDVSLAFAESNQHNPDLIGVLFAITINSSISSSPFANARYASYYQEEEEILFSMHSVFRIGQMKQIQKNDRLWQVDLTLTSDNDPQLRALTEHIREETFPHMKGWYRLGNLLIKLGEFDKAQQVLNIMLEQTTEQHEKANIYHMLGMAKNQQGKYTEAIGFYEKSIEMNQKFLSTVDPNLANSYNNIGSVYINVGEYSKALYYCEKALEIEQKTLPANHPQLAISYNNIGSVYTNMGEYSKALSYFERTLNIKQKFLPANHPDLATCYNNIGTVYINMGEYSKALSPHEKALEIRQKYLPPNHPDLATSYNNMAAVYSNMHDYSKTLSYFQRTLDIIQKILPANHSDLATCYNNIGLVYYKMGEYSKAFSSHEKALEIREKNLPPNHPDLATSYNNIAAVYCSIHDYAKALSYFQRTLDIKQKTLPTNYSDLATCYNNIGSVYDGTGEYSKALSNYQEALEIRQKILPVNHPDLATTYNDIGLAYYKMGEYSKALSSHEKALEIRQKNLPSNHPDLATSYNNMAAVYYNMGDYSEAFSHFVRAHDILQLSLPSNHPKFQSLRKNIEALKKKL